MTCVISVNCGGTWLGGDAALVDNSNTALASCLWVASVRARGKGWEKARLLPTWRLSGGGDLGTLVPDCVLQSAVYVLVP